VSAGARTDPAACARCLRRRWLLGELSPVLDLSSRSDGRLHALLALGDGELIDALGGRRREQLRQRHAEFAPPRTGEQGEAPAICRHDRRYPRGLLHPAAPHLLAVAGGLARLRTLTGAPVVALLGTARATDYGRELARGLGRELAASGVTVGAGCQNGIAQAALAGALEAEGASLAVAGDGLGVRPTAAWRTARELLERRGCTLAELPQEARGRRWGVNAAERTVASLADVAIVIEAEQSPRALAAARLARDLGRTLAACPGRVGSPASAGSHELLREGARLVRDACDVLDLLHDAGRSGSRASAREGEGEGTSSGSSPDFPASLAPRLRAVLELIGAGVDTPGKLTAGSARPGELLGSLGELESFGWLRRGDGGRYVICRPRCSRAARYGGDTQMES
jgi:predicted Rossmann fold nucleotide-binding protein DprA/Smf involved in DNA uptake